MANAPTWNRATLFFTDGSFGWSETYWDTAYGAALKDTLGRATTLARARAAMLAQGSNPCAGGPCGKPVLTWIRISSLSNPRATMVANPAGVVAVQGAGQTNIGSGGSGQVAGLAADNPYSAVLMVANLVGGGTSRRPLSGIPDGFVCDQSLAPGSAFTKAFQRFGNVLANGDWGALSEYGSGFAKPVPFIPNPNVAGGVGSAVAIASVTQDAQGHPVVSLASPLPMPPGISTACGFRATIFGYIGDHKSPNINGTWRMVTTVPYSAGPPVVQQQIRLSKAMAPLASTIACNGWIQFYNPVVVPFTTPVTLERPMSKKRGRPFGLQRGKSKVRR